MNHHAAYQRILALASLIDLRIFVSPSKVGAPHQHQETVAEKCGIHDSNV
jgi:hypothetical protein